MGETLIAADSHWALLSILIAAAAFGIWAERTSWGARVSAAVIAIGTTFALSNLGVVPASAPVYDLVWSYFVPLAIPLLLLRADLRRILREAGPTLLAFLAGAVGTVLGTLLAFRLVPLGEEGWKLAGTFCATYVGGSMNYVATAQALGLRSGELLTAGIAADNLVMTLYFLVLFALPAIPWLGRALPPRARVDAPAATAPATAERRVTLPGMAAALALASATCAVGYGLADRLAIRGGGILLVTAAMVLLATAFPGPLARIGGADEIGTFLMQIFFAAIGASANIGVVLRVGSLLFVFAALILFVHLLFLLAVSRLLRLDLRETVIASNANMGGPTTAAAMAVARGWDSLVIPAILCGTLGYAVATFLGVAIGHSLAP